MSLKNPYKGLFQYHSSDEHFFFGREQEAEELLDMVKNNHLVVIYGESGTGKTSLINAKLFPELRRQYYFPIYIRLNYTSDSTPVKQIQERIVSELKVWDKSVPDFIEGQTLIDYTSSISIFSGLIKPILFFDQFEELFTLGPKNQKPQVLEEFINQLSDLIEVRIKHSKKKQLAESYTVAGSADASYEENLLRFRIVFSMRQEFVAHIDDLKYKMPSILYSKYWLKKFTSPNALEAILGPADIMETEYGESNQTVSYVTQATADKVIGKLLGITSDARTTEENDNLLADNTFSYPSVLQADIIDPTILSLYCYQLVEVGKENYQSGYVVTDELVAKYDPLRIIKDYYELSVKSTRDIRRAIENLLITNEGNRLIRPLKEFIELSGVKENAVVSLAENFALLRIYGSGSGREVEIAHDQIAVHALKSRKRREANRIKVRASIAGFVVIVVIAVIGFFVIQNEKSKKGYDAIKNQRDKLQDEKSNLLNSNDSIKQDIRKVIQAKDSLLLDKTQLAEKNTNTSHSLAEKENKIARLTFFYDSIRKINDAVENANLQLRRKVDNYTDQNSQINNLKADLKKARDSILTTKDLSNRLNGQTYVKATNKVLQDEREKSEKLMDVIRTNLPKAKADSLIKMANQ